MPSIPNHIKDIDWLDPNHPPISTLAMLKAATDAHIKQAGDDIRLDYQNTQNSYEWNKDNRRYDTILPSDPGGTNYAAKWGLNPTDQPGVYRGGWFYNNIVPLIQEHFEVEYNLNYKRGKNTGTPSTRTQLRKTLLIKDMRSYITRNWAYLNTAYRNTYYARNIVHSIYGQNVNINTNQVAPTLFHLKSGITVIPYQLWGAHSNPCKVHKTSVLLAKEATPTNIKSFVSRQPQRNSDQTYYCLKCDPVVRAVPINLKAATGLAAIHNRLILNHFQIQGEF